MAESPVSVQCRGDVAVVLIDNPPVNALSRAVRQGLLAAFDAIEADPEVRAAVITGAGSAFVAGADIREMNAPLMEPHLPDVFDRLDRLDKPVVAALNGAALGGGYELALSCDHRIAGSKASVGLPEVKLGIIPGAGGTQRLPRLVGVARAADLIAAGRVVKAREALSLGMVDALAEGDVVAAAVDAARQVPKRRLSESAVPAEREAPASKRDKGAAATEARRVVALAANSSFADGMAEERATFLRLRDSAEAGALRHLFFAEREAAKVPGLQGVSPRPVSRIAIIGAGTMGSGIAVACADGGLDVDLLDRDEAAAEAGAARVRDTYARMVERGRLSADEAERRVGCIRPSHDWEAVREADLVIEAVFEDMTVKTDVFRRLDELARPGAVLATNTSYLDVNRIAAATARPGDVLGLHFFSPANIMRLVEVVRADQTAPDVLATGIALAKRIGKLPVVAGVCDGFIGNRIWAQYRKVAEYLVEDGAEPVEVDRAMEAYGFAMGPFAVGDLAGLDIAYAMRQRRAATRDPRERYVRIPDILCESGRLGRKTGAGWYSYADGASRGTPDPAVSEIIEAERRAKGVEPRPRSAEAMQRLILAVLANEAAKILEEGVALRPSDIDLVLVNGYGFPSERGGPLFAADGRGLAEVLRDAEEAAVLGGAGLEPANLLRDLSERGSTFAAWAEERAAVD